MTQSSLFKGQMVPGDSYCWAKGLEMSSQRRPWLLFACPGVGCWERASAGTPRRPWSPRSAQRAATWRRASARCATPSKHAPSLTWQRSTRTPAPSSSEVGGSSQCFVSSNLHTRAFHTQEPEPCASVYFCLALDPLCSPSLPCSLLSIYLSITTLFTTQFN